MDVKEEKNLTAFELPTLFRLANEGDAAGREQLFVALYHELHRLAQSELQRNAAVTLSPTTLLHETFLNLAQRDGSAFADKARFMAYAARAMRGLLIDYLRSRQAQKRGGLFEITSLPTELEMPEGDGEMDRLVDALEELGKLDPRLAECVDLKFFSGFSLAEIAQMWSVSERTVQRDWEKARILLHKFMTSDAPSS
jgi:RNA polymerase sigma factor (TIGR02999 family)